MNAEHALLGAVLIDSTVMDDIELSPSDFYDNINGKIWQAILDQKAKNSAIDIVTIGAMFGDRRDYVYQLTDHVPSLHAVASYADEIRNAATRRQITIIAQTLLQDAKNLSGEELLSYGKAELDKLVSGGSTMQTLNQVFESTLDEIQNPAPLIPSGFKALNKIIGGYRNGAMYVVAARPGVGKTLFALQTAFDLAENSGVLFFSMEMGSKELVKRLISSVSSVEAEKIINSKLNDGEWQNIANKRGLFKRNLFIEDRSALTINSIRATYRRTNHTTPIKAIVIDYLGLMADSKNGKSRYEKVTNISNDLKQLARELNVPVIALHQLNREIENRSDPKPTLSDLRDSGAIEQDADVVMLLHREQEMGKFLNVMRIFVSKNRHGTQGLCELTVHPDYVRVVESNA